MHDLTRCVQHPAVSHDGFKSLAVPTYRASTIVYDDPQAFAQRAERGLDGYTYGLLGTPTTRTLEAQLTALHGGERTVLVPSGQAAVALTMLAVLTPGDKVLVPDHVYPPVKGLCAGYLAARGIAHQIYDPLVGGGIAELIDPATRLIWMESPGSATMEVQDVPAIVAAAKARGVLTGCDNTWASPLLFKPLAHGVDFAVEALTKYVGGHSDLLLGSITVKDLGLRKALKDVLGPLGIGVSPDEAALALRGIETMGVRMAHSGRVALDFAKRLQDAPAVARVLHPALPSCPGHKVFARDFAGASTVFSIVIKPEHTSRIDHALGQLRLFAIGASWGGTHSLIAPMNVVAGRTIRPWDAREGLVRLSIGLEEPGELWQDLSRFLDALGVSSSASA
ncbi:Putative cystathionine beta-lyase (CBL; Beta-cystathionase; Cysteine lyase) metC [Bradyrhizobium sp. ORS 285]|uniref:trans-sulfuration enzyme family protein n=1 Tax=Bradyrhizobium sp. ORS 285 TaxID=115808 RepID=UPI000240627E|nr:aminotransferase class I/II-fold pyridoxal phosphate-dependent enzyme [Bradyrhizobium sp. ORS 285]CCD89496.1 putative cystathionine beta-lyase (CBL; Beta-cystathionase; Cysteine lyase) [Bradyrhizobium sp. ORS 285]SMX58744.1 Putative cystathionine beta-lyase (CBL; Beta-cystathionase; Cysteine lyase) metC [Bradyrhizobium sp. ORS 285]